MAFDSSGTFTRISSGASSGSTIWQDDAAAGTKILASRHDTHDQDLAGGLSECLTRTGKGVPLVDIPWGGKKITNLAAPTQPTDATTKAYVDGLSTWSTARNISGADLNGRLNFTAPSGVNGITWSYAQLAWIARGVTTGEANQRLVLSPTQTPDTTGPAAGLADVFIVDDSGRIDNGGILTNNVSYDVAATRTINPGIGTILGYGNGGFGVSSNDVATITNNYALFTPREFFRVANTNGVTTLTLQKSGTSKHNRIQAMNGAEHRWVLDLGNNATESGTRVGSDFELSSYDNTGANAVVEMKINRATHKVTFAGEIEGPGLSTTATGIALGSSTAGSTFALERPIATGSLSVFGGTAAGTGAYLQLYGESHATNGRDIVLGANGTFRYFYDYSTQIHNWASNTASVMTLNGSGNLAMTGTITATGAITSAGSPVKTDANIVYTGTDAANVNFPIGTTLCVVTDTTRYDRNAVIPVRLGETVADWYDISGAGALLTGTWNSRGAIILDLVQNRYLVQRTA